MGDEKEGENKRRAKTLKAFGKDSMKHMKTTIS
jgi:hypothetical protein